jgi:hypothetical protein
MPEPDQIAWVRVAPLLLDDAGYRSAVRAVYAHTVV